MNKNIIVAFDVDGTLVHQGGCLEDTPRYDVIAQFNYFKSIGCRMVIWSGGGVDYARRYADRLGLEAQIWGKGQYPVDIAFDDEIVNLGKVNIRV